MRKSTTTPDTYEELPSADEALPKLAPAPVEAERLAVEEWGLRKGMLPQLITPASRAIMAQPVPDDRAHAYAIDMRHDAGVGTVVNPRFALFEMARVRHHWPIGKTMTEADFDAAVEKHTEVICR